jgi:hypothetical protein
MIKISYLMRRLPQLSEPDAFDFRPLSTRDFACQRVGERTQQFASFCIVTIQASFRAPNRA